MEDLRKSFEIQGYRVLEETVSIEKDTLKLIPALYVEKDGNVYLARSLNDIEKIGSYRYWERIKKFESKKEVSIQSPTNINSCNLKACGLCSAHKNTTALLNIVVTNRCDLRCPYCFFYSEASGFVYEPSLQDIIRMVKSAGIYNGFIPPVQLTGGEPTLRQDLDDIVRELRKAGVSHVQLNTNGVSYGLKYFGESIGKNWRDELFGKLYNRNISIIEELSQLRKNGLNTIYLSFDGVTEKTNTKNHFEVPFAIEAFFKSGITSIVLVPTVSRQNLEEVDKILLFAARNMNRGIRGVNYQPISFVGFAAKDIIEKERVTQSDIIEKLENFGIPLEAWFPVPAAKDIADLIGKFRGLENHVRFYNNEKCGMATYVFVYGDKIYPIIDFVDVEGFLKYLENVSNADGYFEKLKILFSLLFNPSGLAEVIRMKSPKGFFTGKLLEYLVRPELPDGTNLKKILEDIFIKGDYSSLGEFHYKFLFLGMMHFMDEHNYDVKRVERCSIHYGSPDGRIIPFCAYNVFPEKYRDKIFRKYSLKDEEAKKLIQKEKEQMIVVQQIRKNYKESMRSSEIYKNYYRGFY